MKSPVIKDIRTFNRFYTNIIGLLDRHILNSNYSLPEVRIMFELYHKPQLTASDVIALIDIDKGYMSRILKKFHRTKLISKVNSAADKRAAVLQLTAKGKREFETLDKASDKQIEELLKNLSERECEDLIRKMIGIQQILTKGLQHD